MAYFRNFLFLLLFQLVTFPSFACSRRPGEPVPTTQELFEKAMAVFVAHVYRTEEKSWPTGTNEKPFPIVEGDFRVIEVIKGTPPADGKVKDFVFGPPGNCALGLFAGLDYIFFIDEGPEFVLWPDGSRPLINIESTESRRFLETLRHMAPGKSQP